MTENELQLLKFEKQVVEETQCKDFNGNEWFEDGFYYYTYDVTSGLSFITQSNDEVEDDNWFVELFNTDIPIRFHKFEEVQNLLNILEKARVTNE